KILRRFNRPESYVAFLFINVYFCSPLIKGLKKQFIITMGQYETTIILTPLLSEDAAKEVIANFSKILTDNGAEIIQEDNWGLKKLAYPIEKKSTGYYHITEYKVSGEVIGKYELELKRDERVMRFLTVKLDKHAVAYNEKKRSGAFNKKKSEKAEAANRSEEHTSELQSRE